MNPKSGIGNPKSEIGFQNKGSLPEGAAPSDKLLPKKGMEKAGLSSFLSQLWVRAQRCRQFPAKKITLLQGFSNRGIRKSYERKHDDGVAAQPERGGMGCL
ncbi:MAG TPA: hypothetical protein PLZ12_14565 [Saprospiraceae bacterium]|nr:hypothetical protein [Saprospiraceae bacterium]